MGMFSWKCKGCGGEICEGEIAQVRTDNGTTWGEYNGYGRVGFFDACESGYEPAIWHKKCYDKATPTKQSDMSPSKHAPNQGMGWPKPEFC